MQGMWGPGRPLLLASASATRRALLEGAGLPVESVSSGVDERRVEAGLQGADPATIAAALARAKAKAVARANPDRIVLGADQVLDLDGGTLHRPGSRDEAARQIAHLSGRTHRLHSAYALGLGGEVGHEGLDEARLTMRALDAGAVAAYLALLDDGVLASTGIYQVEGVGLHLFERIEGAHSTILGLPLLPLLALFRRLGLLAF